MWTAAIGLLGCAGGSSGSDAGTAPHDASGSTNDGSGSIIIIAGDVRIPDFACDGGGPDHAATEPSDAARETDGCTVSNANVHFRSDILPVLQTCSGELCHAPPSYAATVNVAAIECCDHRRIVDPGNPSGSYLLQKIRGLELCGGSAKMGNVPADVANKIADWICLGALDD
jgi:hypothetical protein